MSTVTSKDGTTIACERSGQGPAVVLVDGAMGNREYFGERPLVAELSNAFTIIAYDRRGRGESTDLRPYAAEREIEDIEALVDEAGGSVFLYGFSSGSVLALRAAAKLGDKVEKLALYGPLSIGVDARAEFAAYAARMDDLLAANRRGDAVAFFLADMMPAAMIDDLRQSPDWPLMEAVAHTIAYDNAVMGDSTVPVAAAKAATMPTLVLDADGSPEFFHEAADALAAAMPNAQRLTLKEQPHVPAPDVLAPVLNAFFLAGTVIREGK